MALMDVDNEHHEPPPQVHDRTLLMVVTTALFVGIGLNTTIGMSIASKLSRLESKLATEPADVELAVEQLDHKIDHLQSAIKEELSNLAQ